MIAYMIEVFIIIGNLSLPFTVSLAFILGYLEILGYSYLGNSYILTKVALFGLFGFITYTILTIIAFLDCGKRGIPSTEKKFWRSVLLRCFYQFCAVLVYYWTVVKAFGADQNRDYPKYVNRTYGNIVYLIFKCELYLFFGFLLLSAIMAGISVIEVRLIEAPALLFKIAIFSITLFPAIFYALYLAMLYEFVQETHDIAALTYYFGQKRWIFGVVSYYKSSRKERDDDL